MSTNYRKIYAIEKKNKERLLKVNPKLNDRSGIYFLLRENENGFRFGYIGQAKNITQRLCGHLAGYQQHIDRSLKAHGLYSEDNPYGWRVEFLNFPESQLDEKEKYYIKLYADKGIPIDNIKVICIIAAPQGIENIQKHYPEIEIITAAVDDYLNEKGYIVPGMGDAGDRIFNT